MPAYDRYHFAVVRALERENWVIVARKRWLYMGRRHVFPDIVAQRDDTATIIVEVKTFERQSEVDALAEALGQVLLYRAIVEARQADVPVILAVPVPAFEGILSEPIGKLIITRYQVPVLVVDVMNERIVQWHP